MEAKNSGERAASVTGGANANATHRMVSHAEDEVLVFWLSEKRFGIRVNEIAEIVSIDGTQFVEVPVGGMNNPSSMGQVQIRERVLPVLNLRKYLGLPTWAETCRGLSELLEARENDHRKWLEELEKSLIEGREFGLQLDPNLCAFGRWYNSFRTHDRRLAQQLKLFDLPHKKIHALGRQVVQFAKEGKLALAKEQVEQFKQNEFQELLKIFSDTRVLLQTPVEPVGILTRTSIAQLGEGVHSASLDSTANGSDHRETVLPVENVETIQMARYESEGKVYVMNDGSLVPALSTDRLTAA